MAASFAALSVRLGQLVAAPAPAAERQRFWRDYVAFLATLSEADRRYLGLQVWQEGVARYVELRVAEAAAAAYTPTLEYRHLPDGVPFAAAADTLRARLLRALAHPDLPGRQRVSFYAFGAGLALLLDQEGAAWKERYLKEKFFLERYTTALARPPER